MAGPRSKSTSPITFRIPWFTLRFTRGNRFFESKQGYRWALTPPTSLVWKLANSAPPPLHPWFGNFRTPFWKKIPLFGKKLHQCGAEQRASRCGVFWPCWCVGVLCAEICRLQRAVLCVDNIYRLCGSVICSVMCIDSDLNFWFFFKPLVE